MKNQKLKRVAFCAGIAFTLFSYRLYGIHADIYREGMITVKHEELPVRRDAQRIRFHHPYELEGGVVANALSNIYYKEKGLFKRKETLRVFQDIEIHDLVPLIVKAFSDATPTQVVSISSYYNRAVLADRYTYCILFITDRSLNIAFSKVHTFQSYNDIMSEKKRYLVTKENPANKKHSGFWKLIPSAGQHLEPDHENWLVIDLSHEISRQQGAMQPQ